MTTNLTKLTTAEEILGGFVAGAVDAGLKFHCYRCGEALTDPASVEAGIGPVCRKLANAALALTIPADVDTVLAHLSGVTFRAEALTNALAAITSELTEGVTHGRADWRSVAHVLTRLIAYGTVATKESLCNAIDALGYTTLAAVAREEASPSTATLAVVGTRLVLRTKRNAAALSAIKAISGRRFHPEDKTWSFPATEFRAALDIVHKFFPLTKLTVLELATEVAKAVTASKPAPVTTKVTETASAPSKTAPSVTFTEAPGGFNVVSPYNPSFVADLKTSLPYKARAWTGSCWWVSASALEIVRELAEKHYGVEAIAA